MKRLSLRKAILSALSFMLLFALTQTSFSATKEIKIKTSAVCDQCKAAIEKKMKKTDGVETSSLEVSTKTLTVRFDDSKTTADKIRKAVAKTGYDADNMIADKAARKKLPKCCQGDGK